MMGDDGPWSWVCLIDSPDVDSRAGCPGLEFQIPTLSLWVRQLTFLYLQCPLVLCKVGNVNSVYLMNLLWSFKDVM